MISTLKRFRDQGASCSACADRMGMDFFVVLKQLRQMGLNGRFDSRPIITPDGKEWSVQTNRTEHRIYACIETGERLHAAKWRKKYGSVKDVRLAHAIAEPLRMAA